MSGMTVEQRNDVFIAHMNLIHYTVHRNRPLLMWLRMDMEDMVQELAIYLLKAIETFDPERGRKEANYYLDCLQYGVLNINRTQQTGNRIANLTARPLVFTDEDGEETEMEIPHDEDFTTIYADEFLALLSERERDVLEQRLGGVQITDLRQKSYMRLIEKKAARFFAGRVTA